ncbi:hypothetical protein VTJ49DRAFT_3405 [Mycothermus thermophilus]|uniref:Uncharacterized protein n=1 Tax=Humicola insolens TaxID=85995 RepID=A0ABR3V7N6_HUMIN
MATLYRTAASLPRVVVLRTNLDNVLRTRTSFPNLRHTADQHFSNATSSGYDIIESQAPTDPSLHHHHPAPSQRPGTPPPCDERLSHTHTTVCLHSAQLYHLPPRPSSSVGFSAPHTPAAPTSAPFPDYSLRGIHTTSSPHAPPVPPPTGSNSSSSSSSQKPAPPPPGRANQPTAETTSSPGMDFGEEVKGNPTESEADVAADRSDLDPLPPGLHHTIRMGPGEAGPLPTESEADVAADLGRAGEDPVPVGEHFTERHFTERVTEREFVEKGESSVVMKGKRWKKGGR